MKKIILSLSVCSAILLFSSCSDKDSKVIVEIPDANFKAYLLENFDKNNDSNMSLSEVKAVKEINCSGRNIERLDGIEKFENLESLDCSNNKLDELVILYNRKLNKLVCSGNNVGMFLYVGMKSPLRNQNIKVPNANEPPQAENISNPLDENKCTYDQETTNISLSFDD